MREGEFRSIEATVAETARVCTQPASAGVPKQTESCKAAGHQMVLPLREEHSVTSTENCPTRIETATPAEAAAGACTLGARLRAARESYGWSVAEIGAELHLPARLIERLENDDYAGISDAVFLRGYLASYARLVSVPIEQTREVIAAHAHVAPLVATGTISRSRYLFERYSASATYLVLTAIIVVPAVWLATHGGLRKEFARVTPLDPPARVMVPVATTAGSGTGLDAHAADTSTPAMAAAAADASTPNLAPSSVGQAPIVASMTPFQVAEPPRPAEAETAATGEGAHVLKLRIAQASWVEVLTSDGHKLEYSMLPADSEHEYRSDGSLFLRIGNAQGAQVAADGKAIDLAPFRRGNVAHLQLFGSGEASAARAQQ